MLPKVNRLRLKQDYWRVFQGAKRFRSPLLEILVVPGKTKHSRVGVLLRRGLLRKPQRRNFWKRRLREAARKNLKEIKSSHDIVILLKKVTVPSKKTAGLAEELHSLFEQANLL